MNDLDDDCMEDEVYPLHRPLAPSLSETALAALQFMPMPILVLSSFKTIILANDAMARLLNLPTDSLDDGDLLLGKSLTEIGVDIVENGLPVWLDLNHFLESIGKDTSNPGTSGESTPTGAEPLTASNLHRTVVHDLAVEVAITPKRPLSQSNEKIQDHFTADMIVSVWHNEGAKHFTLTFTSAAPRRSQPPKDRATPPAPSRRSVMRSTRNLKPSSSSSSDTASTISSITPQAAMFPPMGPPLSIASTNAHSDLQKISRLKDALLNSMNLPCHAVWKDESVGVPNRALLRLAMGPDADVNCDQREFLARFQCYTLDFSRPLRIDEYPIVRVLTTQQPVVQALGIKDVNGHPRIFDVHGETIHDEMTGMFLGAYVILKDVTSYMDLIQEQKKAGEAQLAMITQRIPQMVFTATAEGIGDWFSDSWYEYTGLTFAQSSDPAISAEILWWPDDKVLVTSSWERAIASGIDFQMEIRCRRKDDVYRWMLVRAVPLRDDNGLVLRWFGTCTDIHDSVAERDHALRTQERLRQVIETARVTLWAIDLNRSITMFEGALTWQNANGAVFSIDEILGQDIFEVIKKSQSVSGMVLDDFFRPIDNILSGRSHEEVSNYATNEGRAFRGRYLPLLKKDRDGKTTLDGCVGVLMDVTELRAREFALQHSEKENARLVAKTIAAKEASRMKSNFLATVSHEIRTPIAGVIGLSELLLDSPLNAVQKDYADNIQRSANALLTVINDILDFSKVESGRLDIEEVQFSLNNVIRDIGKMLSFTAIRKNLAYVTDIGPEIGRDLRLIGDPGRLRQIITNLLTNSIKFTSEGSVKLSVRVKAQNADQVVVSFVVQDTGIGMEGAVLSRLFTPFCQADSSTARRYGGTGLGLAISKNLVDLMHGQIEIKSAAGMGTTAEFYIPFRTANDLLASPLDDANAALARGSVSASMGTSEESPDSIKVHANKSKMFERNSPTVSRSAGESALDEPPNLAPEERQAVRVLVVEDNPVNQKIALKTVEKFHFPVQAVWNGKEAVDFLLENQHEPPEIILMDCQMPILDGYEATRAIRSGTQFSGLIRQTPIIAMTASAIRGDKEKCERAGMDDYLAKPVKGKILESMLVKWAIEGKKRRQAMALGEAMPQRVDERSLSNAMSSRASSPAQRDDGLSPLALVASSLSQISYELQDSEMLDDGGDPAVTLSQSGLSETAILLRDNKLLSAAFEDQTTGIQKMPGQAVMTGKGSHAMTEENMAEFDARTSPT